MVKCPCWRWWILFLFSLFILLFYFFLFYSESFHIPVFNKKNFCSESFSFSALNLFFLFWIISFFCSESFPFSLLNHFLFCSKSFPFLIWIIFFSDLNHYYFIRWSFLWILYHFVVSLNSDYRFNKSISIYTTGNFRSVYYEMNSLQVPIARICKEIQYSVQDAGPVTPFNYHRESMG